MTLMEGASQVTVHSRKNIPLFSANKIKQTIDQLKFTINCVPNGEQRLHLFFEASFSRPNRTFYVQNTYYINKIIFQTQPHP